MSLVDGVAIVDALLREHAPLIAIVAKGNIKGGQLQDGVALPAILVRSISLTERQTLKRGATVRTTERIAVTVRAESYRTQRAVIALVRSCCAGRTGDLGGASRVSILTAGTGPEMAGPADSFERTQDFAVSFDAPA